MNGSPAIDFNPPGSSVSGIYGAGGGQQVGLASIGGVSVSGVWSGSANSFVGLNPPLATSTGVSDCEGGLQVGHVALAGGPRHAVVWAGNAQSFVDLHATLPTGYSVSQASGIDVDANGAVTISGQAYNVALSRYEAFVWRGQGAGLSANLPSLSTSAGGAYQLTIAAGLPHAGHTYMIVGSFSGTAPGLAVAPGVHLPLVVDGYSILTVTVPNFWLSPSTGTLDPNGNAVLTGILPPGLLQRVGPLPVYHAALVLDAVNTGFAAATNAVTLTLLP
jgi:hypothetical protein